MSPPRAGARRSQRVAAATSRGRKPASCSLVGGESDAHSGEQGLPAGGPVLVGGSVTARNEASSVYAFRRSRSIATIPWRVLFDPRPVVLGERGVEGVMVKVLDAPVTADEAEPPGERSAARLETYMRASRSTTSLRWRDQKDRDLGHLCIPSFRLIEFLKRAFSMAG